MVKTLLGGGSDLSPEMQKIYDKLVELLKGGKKLDISIDELKKKAGVSNVKNTAVSAFIVREKKKGTKFFKNISVKQFSGGLEAGVSQHDPFYKSSKNFRNFIQSKYKPWNELNANYKDMAFKTYLRNKGKITKPGFTLTPSEMAKKFGITTDSLLSYQTPKFEGIDDSTKEFIKNNVKKIRTIVDGKSVTLYKDPSETVLKNWKLLQDRTKISKTLIERVEEYDKKFRDIIIKEKRLPRIGEVIRGTSMSTPATVARTEALYSRLLRGEKFRRKVNVAVNVNAGQKIIDELALDSSFNARRSAFYNLALDNINKMYPHKSGTLGTFKTNFRNELKDILGTKKVPFSFSVNEVIGLSTGESRGIQPFSVFVDAVEKNINKVELASYQGQFSKKLKEVDEILQGKGEYKNFTEAQRIKVARDVAGNLGRAQVALRDKLLAKGFTQREINQLNLPDIAVSKDATKTYLPKDLARWKKQSQGGVDIGQFAKERGFYVDIKKGLPFWESKVNNTVIAAAKNNIGNICNIFKGRIAYSADGGRIGFQGGCGREMTIAMQTDSKGTLQQITKTKGIIPKFKNVAQGFLGTLGKFGPKVGKYGAIAAAGAIAQPLIKQFMNDDPSTYLTNEDQIKGMLLSTIEAQERKKPRSEILDWTHTGATVGATAAAVPGSGALYKFRRGLSEAKIPKAGPITEGGLTAGDYLSKHAGKDYGKLRAGAGVGMKALSGMFTPAGLLATEPLRIAQKRREGESWGDIATSPMTWMGPAFAPGMAKMATSGMKKGALLARALRLGIPLATFNAWNPIGWSIFAASIGLEGYSQYSDYKKKRGFFAKD